MKVYRVNINPDEYQTLLPATSNAEIILDAQIMGGVPKLNNWVPVEHYIINPLAKKGNFYSLSTGGAFACDKIAADRLRYYWEIAGELLPVFLQNGTPLFIINITECLNCLDQENSVFDYYKDGTKGRILKHAFHESRLSESSIFKIPETVKTQVLTYTGVKAPHDEFYTAYMESGLKGLTFELLYSNG